MWGREGEKRLTAEMGQWRDMWSPSAFLMESNSICRWFESVPDVEISKTAAIYF
jgi:hypothetical protein